MGCLLILVVIVSSQLSIIT